MNTEPAFLFVVCQVGAEPALKAEIARQWPTFRFAFSRPGFVTFKLDAAERLASDFDLRSTFARTYGFSLGKLAGETAETLAADVWRMVADQSFDVLHVWQRDTALPGQRGFEPGPTALAHEIGEIIAAARPLGEPSDEARAASRLRVNAKAHAGDRVLDCVLVEPNQWWVGWHQAASLASRWPGGVFPLREPPAVVSRAYRKMAEGLAWSQLPIAPGDLCAELGSAPGGASQLLLERGLRVLGIDPAEMDDAILSDPNFVHVRKRAMDMRRREFRGVKWLFADSNVAPQHTLDAVAHIVTHENVHVQGLVLTLKLLDWSLADKIPEYIEQVRSWGFAYVRTRQLAFNRQEICLAALRNRSMRRLRRGRATAGAHSDRTQPIEEQAETNAAAEADNPTS